MGRGPVCRDSNPQYERTVGSYGINDEADPRSPTLIPRGRRLVDVSPGLQAQVSVQRDLSELELKFGAALTQFDAELQANKAPTRKQIAAAHQLRRIWTTNQCLIRVARQAASGHQKALTEIARTLTEKSGHPRTRQMAANLLAILDSTQSFKALAARVTDPTEDWPVRFYCAILLGGGGHNFNSFPLRLMVINHPATGDPSLEVSGIPFSLRSLLVDQTTLMEEREELEKRVREPLTFQHGWLHTILELWRKTQENDWRNEHGPEYVEIAAKVLQLRSAPKALRVDAATALYIMRRQGKSGEPFPRLAWDALHGVYREDASGDLHDLVRKTLMMQGNAKRR